MASKQKRDIKRNIWQLKRKFLESRGSQGGDKLEFISEIISNIKAATEGVEVEDALKEMVAECAGSVWESKPKRKEDQLVIAGFEIDQEIRFPDESAPSGYRTVLAPHCTIRQHRLSIAMLEAERDDRSDKIKKQIAANRAATRKAGGNLDALMIDCADEPAPV